MFRWFLVGCVVLVLSAPAWPAQPVEKEIESLIARYGTSGKVGVHVVRLSDHATIVDHHAKEPLMPASNQKLVTSAVVFKKLGKTFKFNTLLGMDGGDLVVIGDGDPSSGDATIARNNQADIYAVFDGWAAQLKAAGITTVPGKILIKSGIYQGPMYCADWPEKHRRTWYGAPVAGVNFNDNCLDVTFNVEGSLVTPILSPADPFIRIDNKLTATTGKPVWDFSYPNDTGLNLVLKGTAKSSKDPVYPPFPNPPMLYGTVLADRLAKAGIECKGPVEIVTTPIDNTRPGTGFKLIASAQTPLSDPLHRANKQSLNMMAEGMFLRAAAEPGSPSSWEKAAKVAKDVLVNQYKIDPALVNVVDGSGLSRGNTVAPAALTAILAALHDEPTFVESLAIGGVDGSLMKRFTKAPYKGRVVAKTGTLTGVSALSGYVTDKTGQPVYAFSVLVNNGANAKDIEDGVAEALIRQIDSQK